MVGAFYYIRIIKIMYFDEAAEPFDNDTGAETGFIIGASAIAVVGLFVFLAPIENAAKVAASAVFGGVKSQEILASHIQYDKRHFGSVGSTNDIARELGGAGMSPRSGRHRRGASAG